MFFDTNVLASALMGHGLCRDLLDRVVIEHVVVLGVPVREELHRVLMSKFRVPGNLWRELNKKLLEFEQAPSVDDPLPIAVSDSDDIPILACAVAAKVDIFVTGDKALIDLGFVEGMPILTPRRLWQKLLSLA
ncbi:MAG TPA: putative toxin-antitoxin system toxin component, PIN family [Gammaproteobacteria bacterium]|nr:putative toxin-antitoxin system toxin component, PIN family [Gammaproteobacteria bacterium]